MNQEFEVLMLDLRYNNLLKAIFRDKLFVAIIRFDNCFFCKKEAKDQAWSAMIKLLKTKVVAELDSQQN